MKFWLDAVNQPCYNDYIWVDSINKLNTIVESCNEILEHIERIDISYDFYAYFDSIVQPEHECIIKWH